MCDADETAGDGLARIGNFLFFSRRTLKITRASDGAVYGLLDERSGWRGYSCVVARARARSFEALEWSDVTKEASSPHCNCCKFSSFGVIYMSRCARAN